MTWVTSLPLSAWDRNFVDTGSGPHPASCLMNAACCILVVCIWNVMVHARKPDLVFRRNGRVQLSRRGRQFSRLLAAEVCASAVVMLDTTCSEVVWRVLATYSIRQFPLHFPYRASPCAITFQLDPNYAPRTRNWPLTSIYYLHRWHMESYFQAAVRLHGVVNWVWERLYNTSPHRVRIRLTHVAGSYFLIAPRHCCRPQLRTWKSGRKSESLKSKIIFSP